MNLIAIFILFIPPLLGPKQYRPDRTPIITQEYCESDYERNIIACRVRYGTEVSLERQACEVSAFGEFIGCLQSVSP